MKHRLPAPTAPLHDLLDPVDAAYRDARVILADPARVAMLARRCQPVRYRVDRRAQLRAAALALGLLVGLTVLAAGVVAAVLLVFAWVIW